MAPVAGAALFRSVSVCYIESLGQSIVSTNILIDYVLGGRVLKSLGEFWIIQVLLSAKLNENIL